MNYGNNRRLTLGYEASRHQMTQMVVDNQNGTNAIISKAYQYVTSTGYGAPNDNDGRIKKITDNLDGNYTTTYSYDEYNRLYSASATAFTRSYFYDAWGNITSTGGGASGWYTLPTNANGAPATNRMSSFNYHAGGSTAYTWDAAGNMTGEGATSFQYDAASRLKTVNNGTTETNGFDGDSQRVKKVEGSVTVFYVRSSIIKQGVMEIGGNGALYRANVYAGSQKLIGQLSPDGQFYWRHENHLGSGYKLTNSAGTVVYRAEHDPHGNVLLETGTTTLTAHKFTSYERDNSTGLDYANARMYSGSRGRFTKPDPIGLKAGNTRKPQSLNLYTYVGNDPANFVDTGGTCFAYWNQVSDSYGFWDDIGCDPYTPPHHSVPLDGMDPYAQGNSAPGSAQPKQKSQAEQDLYKMACDPDVVKAMESAAIRGQVINSNSKIEAGFVQYKDGQGNLKIINLPYTNEADRISGIGKHLADNGISTSDVVGLYHTHPASSAGYPSDTDRETSDKNGFPIFVMHKNGLAAYDPVTKQIYNLRGNMDWVNPCPP